MTVRLINNYIWIPNISTHIFSICSILLGDVKKYQISSSSNFAWGGGITAGTAGMTAGMTWYSVLYWRLGI